MTTAPPSATRLLIANMVCQRCINAVTQELRHAGLKPAQVSLGEVWLQQPPTAAQLRQLNSALQALGFALIETRTRQLIEQIKQAILAYLQLGDEAQHTRLSAFITRRIPNDYSYLSDLFSSVTGKTIEQYFLQQRIEKVKELMVYDQLSLTEIAYRTGFSSVHHLSAQFKKLTGMTPTHFKKLGAHRRRAADEL